MNDRFGSLTYEEIRERATAGALAIVPTGCTEQQGPHLPVDFDTWFAETQILAAAERARVEYGIDTLVLPALPFGPTPEHRGFDAGYIHIPTDVHAAFVRAILTSLVEQGFRRIVVWRGCGGHDLSEMVDAFNRQHVGVARAFLPEPPFYDVWCRLGDLTVPGGHADSFATSIMLHLQPNKVRIEKIANPHSEAVDWNDPDLDFSKYSHTGVIGDPTHASGELGAQLWAETVRTVALLFRTVATTPINVEDTYAGSIKTQ